MDVDLLRRETRGDHEAVEAALSLMNPSLTRQEYVASLRRLNGIVLAWEELAEARSFGFAHELLLQRQRRHLLQKDLTWWGVEAAVVNRPVLPPIQNEARLLGAMYVMEGSTLGGQVIARHVDKVLNLEGGAGSAFFHGHREQTGTMWRDFCELLQSRVPDNDTQILIAAAREMFQVFGSWMKDSDSER